MKVHGRCHCGKVTYEAEIAPGGAGICHCTDCQQLSGSAYRVVVRATSFTLTGAAPKVYIKTANSGTKRAQAFCPNCGSPIYAASPENPQSWSLRWGSIVERAQLYPPTREIWCCSAMPWARHLQGMAQAQRQG